MIDFTTRMQAPFPGAEDLKAHIYSGAILQLQQPSALQTVIERARALIAEYFPGSAPWHSHQHMNAEAFCETARTLRARARQDARLRQAFIHFLSTLGFDAYDSGLDALLIRIQPPAAYRPGFNTLAPHRDTWGSGLSSQINWWLPLYSLDPGATMALYPYYWDKSVANTAAGWDWKAVRNLGPEEKRRQENLLPIARQSIPRTQAVPVLPEVGDIMAFSGTHLHASLPNETEQIRFSLDTRTIAYQDEQTGRGAPCRDGQPLRVAWEWFAPLVDSGSA